MYKFTTIYIDNKKSEHMVATNLVYCASDYHETLILFDKRNIKRSVNLISMAYLYSTSPVLL